MRPEPLDSDEVPKRMRAGVYVYGIGSIAAGILDIVWGNFEPAHQPIQAFGGHIPGQRIFAYVVAVWLVAGGAAILGRRAARAGAAALALVYLLFAVFWLPRFYTAPLVLGFRIPVYIGVLGGVGTQLIAVAAGAIVYTSLARSRASWEQKTPAIVHWIFGLCSIDFGLAHLTGVRAVAAMVPKWMPLGGDFWTILSGIAFVLAGVAMLSGILDVLAVRLLALMLLIFNVVVLVPLPFASPGNHVAWGANAYNLAAVGAVWIFSESIASRRPERQPNYHWALSLIGRHP